MAQLAVDDEAGRQLDEGEVVLGLLFPTDQEPPEAVEPGMRDLHHPPSRGMADGITGWRQGLRGTGLGGNVGDGAPDPGRLPADGVVVAPIEAQVRAVVRGRRGWTGKDGGVKEVGEFLHVVAIGAGQDDGDGHAPSLGQRVPLGATLAPVGGVAAGRLRLAQSPLLPNGAFTKQPSAACHCQSRPTSPS